LQQNNIQQRPLNIHINIEFARIMELVEKKLSSEEEYQKTLNAIFSVEKDLMELMSKASIEAGI
jgi:hypothetical protein